MWEYNYIAANTPSPDLTHSFKGTKWKNHKYVAKKNGRYVYPGGKEAKEKLKEKSKEVREDLREGLTELPNMQNPDLYDKDEFGRPLPARERAAQRRKQQRLENRQKTEQAAKNSLKRNTIARAKENGISATESARAWKAAKRRKDTVDRAKQNAQELAKQQDVWKRKKAYTERINASKKVNRLAERDNEKASVANTVRSTWDATKHRAANISRISDKTDSAKTKKKKASKEQAKSTGLKAFAKFGGIKFKRKKQ